MNPSIANSEVAGIGSPVSSPRTNFTGSPNNHPAISNSDTPHGFVPARDFRQYRILTEADHDRTRLSLGPIFFPNQPAVLARRNPDAEGIVVVHTNAISADVGPFLFGILHDHHAARADVPAAVMLVPARRGKFEQIDFVAAVDVLRYRHHCDTSTGLSGFWLPSFSFHARMISRPRQLRIQAESQRRRRRRTNRIGHDAKSFWITFDVVEQHDLWVRRPRRHFGDRAEFQIPIRAVDDAQLAKSARPLRDIRADPYRLAMKLWTLRFPPPLNFPRPQSGRGQG